MLPLTILNLVVLGPVQAWQYGVCSVAMDRIDAVGVAEWVARERICTFAAVPTVIHDLLTHPDVRPEQLASLTQPLIGGAECPEEFRALYRERFGSDVAIGYGMTEAPTAVTRAEGEPQPKPGLCGRALPQTEITIRGEDGRELPAGEEGEICVGPARTRRLGVHVHADARLLEPARRHRGGARGRRLPHGRHRRARRRWHALHPRPPQRADPARRRQRVSRPRSSACCWSIPAVAEAAVLGIPDRRLGERVVAAVRLEAGADASDAALREHCLASLARYKVPDAIARVDALPRNAMAKVIKRELRTSSSGELITSCWPIRARARA